MPKLAEDPDRESTLSPARARIGAQKLALAGVLSQTAAFLLPGEEQDERAGDALVPGKLLPDWSDAEIKELLTRGLFDEATYGRVRIHHRQAQEYLAADELLLEMVEHGEVAQCAAAALVIALDPASHPYLRVAAIEATAKAGTDKERAALIAALIRPGELQRGAPLRARRGRRPRKLLGDRDNRRRGRSVQGRLRPPELRDFAAPPFRKPNGVRYPGIGFRLS